MGARKKVALSTAGLTAFALLGLLLTLPAVPVHFSGSTSLPMASGFVPVDNQTGVAYNTCAQVFALFPQTGAALVNYSAGGQGFRFYNLSLSTAFQYWYTFNDGSWYPDGLNDGGYRIHNETTTYFISGNLNSLLAVNDQLSLKGGRFLFAVNGSRDSQVTATNSAATLLQYNSTTISVSVDAQSLQATIGPVMAKVLNIPAMSFTASSFHLAYLFNCQTGKTSYSFSATMTGTAALLAAVQRSSLDVAGAGH